MYAIRETKIIDDIYDTLKEAESVADNLNVLNYPAFYDIVELDENEHIIGVV